MRTEGDEIHVSEEEASGGSKEGVVRWVLIFGTLIAIVALSAIWIGGALSTNDLNADNANVGAKIAAEQELGASDTDSIVTPNETATAAGGDQTIVRDGDPVITN